MALIQTKAALAMKNAETNFQVIKYESYKKKKKEIGDVDNSVPIKQDPDKSRKDLELKKIRHEIVKFGMSGFDGSRKEEAKIALAVSLGAKPPKREYVNYKELMENRKQEKLKEKEEKQQMISKSVLHSVGKKKKKGPGNDVGHLLSSYGKVQKKDLKKDTKSTTKKKKKKLI